MRNIFENIAVLLVIIFSLAIIVLIVQYNLINEKDNVYLENLDGIEKNTMIEQKKTNYLDTLEKYRDVDVKVDPRQTSRENQIKVKVEDDTHQNNNLPKHVNDVGMKIDALLNQ